MQGSVSADQVCQDSIIIKIHAKLQAKKGVLKNIQSSCNVAIQYIDMIDILRKYICAECTGNWKFHLQAVSEMLLYLAASGHNSYVYKICINIPPANVLPSG